MKYIELKNASKIYNNQLFMEQFLVDHASIDFIIKAAVDLEFQ